MISLSAYSETVVIPNESLLNVSANEVILDDKQQLVTYSGSVLIHYGVHQLSAPTISTKKTKDGSIMIAKGDKFNMVMYQNKDTKNLMSIKSSKVVYRDVDKTFVFSGDVVMKTKNSRMEGDRISYNTKTGGFSGNANKGKRISTLVKF